MMQKEHLSERYALVANVLQHYFFPAFTPVQRGRRRKGVEVKIVGRRGASMTIRMFEQLDIADQDLFLAIMSIAARGVSVDEDGKLDVRGAIKGWQSIEVDTTGRELLAIAGKKQGGSAHDWLKRSMRRLASTIIVFEGEESEWSCNLMSYGFNKDKRGKVDGISIAINPVAAIVLLGGAEVGYTVHSLGERHALHAEVERALHAYLVGAVRKGAKRSFSLEHLVNQVYGSKVYGDDVPEKTMQNRKTAVRKALGALNNSKGWKVLWSDRNTAVVMRYGRVRHNAGKSAS